MNLQIIGPSFDVATDEQYMRRALELARQGAGMVSPNPLVGCVIVHNDRIIGEGWHKKYGEAHAEVNAVDSVTDKSLLPLATVYVNLEPCSHHGKTPPCADLLIEQRIRRIVIANLDTNPLVGGRGIQKLKNAGVEVMMGVLEKEGRELNKRFFKFVGTRYPYVILKWAQTADGFVARSDGESKWISNSYSRQLVHRWRSEEDAVLVGRLTAEMDNPHLNVRDWSGRDPIRIVMDKSLRLDAGLNMFDGTQQTLCYNLKKSEVNQQIEFVRLSSENFLDALLRDLHDRNIQSVIVEGGAKTLSAFMHAGLWDEARIFYAPTKFGEGIPAPNLNGFRILESKVGDDLLSILTPVRT